MTLCKMWTAKRNILNNAKSYSPVLALAILAACASPKPPTEITAPATTQGTQQRNVADVNTVAAPKSDALPQSSNPVPPQTPAPLNATNLPPQQSAQGVPAGTPGVAIGNYIVDGNNAGSLRRSLALITQPMPFENREAFVTDFFGYNRAAKCLDGLSRFKSTRRQDCYAMINSSRTQNLANAYLNDERMNDNYARRLVGAFGSSPLGYTREESFAKYVGDHRKYFSGLTVFQIGQRAAALKDAKGGVGNQLANSGVKLLDAFTLGTSRALIDF